MDCLQVMQVIFAIGSGSCACLCQVVSCGYTLVASKFLCFVWHVLQKLFKKIEFHLFQTKHYKASGNRTVTYANYNVPLHRPRFPCLDSKIYQLTMVVDSTQFTQNGSSNASEFCSLSKPDSARSSLKVAEISLQWSTALFYIRAFSCKSRHGGQNFKYIRIKQIWSQMKAESL